MPDLMLIGNILFFLAVTFTMLLVMRRAVLWYWKINRAIALLESIDESLKCLPAVRKTRAAAYRAKLSA
jgi:hypothetical protein